MAELVQFFFSSSGCKGQVDVEAFDDLDIASTVEDLSVPENFSEVQQVYIPSVGKLYSWSIGVYLHCCWAHLLVVLVLWRQCDMLYILYAILSQRHA